MQCFAFTAGAGCRPDRPLKYRSFSATPAARASVTRLPSVGFTDKFVDAAARTFAGVERFWVLAAGHIEADSQSVAGEFVNPGERPAIKSLTGEWVFVMKDANRPCTGYAERKRRRLSRPVVSHRVLVAVDGQTRISDRVLAHRLAIINGFD